MQHTHDIHTSFYVDCRSQPNKLLPHCGAMKDMFDSRFLMPEKALTCGYHRRKALIKGGGAGLDPFQREHYIHSDGFWYHCCEHSGPTGFAMSLPAMPDRAEKSGNAARGLTDERGQRYFPSNGYMECAQSRDMKTMVKGNGAREAYDTCSGNSIMPMKLDMPPFLSSKMPCGGPQFACVRPYIPDSGVESKNNYMRPTCVDMGRPDQPFSYPNTYVVTKFHLIPCPQWHARKKRKNTSFL
eukprot:GEMP01060117.1.p1 GENE.GEMP01060117.1~~GEMP01060117.1.p1  ORF type:complete len:241 (+),score=38.02 GEMP01060117.1:179-901(+)